MSFQVGDSLGQLMSMVKGGNIDIAWLKDAMTSGKLDDLKSLVSPEKWSKLTDSVVSGDMDAVKAELAGVEVPGYGTIGTATAATAAAAAAAIPRVETPKVEVPKVEVPKVEAPKVEAPKVEAPKVEAPKVEAARPPVRETVPPPEPEKKRSIWSWLIPLLAIAAVAGLLIWFFTKDDDDDAPDLDQAKTEYCQAVTDANDAEQALAGLSADSTVDEAQQATEDLNDAVQAADDAREALGAAQVDALKQAYSDLQSAVDSIEGNDTIGDAQAAVDSARQEFVTQWNDIRDTNC